MAENQRIVEAILGALSFRGATPERLSSLSQSEWQDLLLYADLSHLTLPLAVNCSGYLPEWVYNRVQQNLRDNTARAKAITTAYREVQGAFNAAGIEHIVLKGFAQCPDYVSDMSLRFQSDLDLYCPPSSIFRAAEVLRQLEYEAIPTPPNADHLPVMIRKESWNWRGNPYDPEMPPSIELHYRFWNRDLMRFGPAELQQFYWRRISRSLGDLSFPGLSIVDNLGFSALEVLRDLLWFGLLAHKPYELAYFLHRRADDGEFWDEWKHTHDEDLRSWQAISFFLAASCFECNLSTAVAEQIERLPSPILKWIARHAKESLITYRTLNKNAVWMHVALVQPLLGKFMVVMRMFPKNPEIQRALGTSAKRDPDFRSWKDFVRYILYCLSRVPRHVVSVPRTLYRGAGLLLPQHRRHS
ncbi:MAG TPA: nucleotidyltransferase family protein [Candidatus Sulfotelmatobacter sp.]|nr:nucleotidyltransferase family protein [Candidatus Sulfotelmatobacter sp.]